MLSLLLHPEMGDQPGSLVVFLSVLAAAVAVLAGVLYLAFKLLRAFFSRGKGG